jgi:hypothetical protein
MAEAGCLYHTSWIIDDQPWEASTGDIALQIRSSRSSAPASGRTAAGSTGNGLSLEIAQT